MSVSRSLRFQILRRDGHACRYCGATAPEVKLNVDHVLPTALGGTDHAANLVTACADCNGGKSATPPDAAHVAQVADDAHHWSAAIQTAAKGMLADLETRNAAHDAFDAKWKAWGTGPVGNRQEVPRPTDWAQSVDQFIAAGLPLPVLLDCIDSAMGREKLKPDNVFRYVCGIAWRKVGELQDNAKHLLGSAPREGKVAPRPVDKQYRELLNYALGMLPGAASIDDARVLAEKQRDAYREDEEGEALDLLDDEGFALLAMIGHAGTMLAEVLSAAQRMLRWIPESELRELREAAEDELAEDDADLRDLDGGHLWKQLVAARMFSNFASAGGDIGAALALVSLNDHLGREVVTEWGKRLAADPMQAWAAHAVRTILGPPALGEEPRPASDPWHPF